MQQFSFLPSPRFLAAARFGAFAVVLVTTLYQPIDGVAQALNPDYLRSMSMRAIGPATMSGRVTAIAGSPDNPNLLYIGAASGGVWRSKSGGTRWEPIFDAAPTQSVGSIALNPQNPDEIWVGTGEGNPRNSQNFGAGIFKSIDGGRTWACKGLTETRSIHRIRLHRDNPDILWAAAMGSGNGPSTERGVFKSTDGGKNWRKVLYVNDFTGCAELIADPANPNKLYAAMWEYRRWPWFFKSGGAGSGLYISFDGGETWSRRTEKDGLPEGELGRIGLAVAPSRPDVVYALVEAKENALYKSTDGGRNWRKMAEKNMGDRPFYYAEIYVDPKNENRVYSIHTVITRSEDGGKTFDTWAGWRIHPDHHAFWIHPEDPDFIVNGNDGGVNITRDGGQTWQYAENIPVGQFYHVNVDNEMPYNVYGGLQDNGSWAGPSSIWRQGGIRNADWQEVLFGDGFDVMPRRDNSRWCFAMSQGGELSLVDRQTGFSEYLKPLHPDSTVLRWNWNAALAQDPYQNAGLYFGSQFLHYSPDLGRTWRLLSPDLTTNDTAKMHQNTSGGLTMDATSAENHCTILAIAPSPVQQGVIWVGTDDGNLQLTLNGGKSWENLSKQLPDAPANAWIPQIEVSTRRAGEAFVVLNNYRQNDWAPYLYHTTNFGKKWKRLANPKNVQGFCLSVVQDPEEPGLLFLGTDQGLYVSIDYGDTWTHWPGPTAEQPNVFPYGVPVQDMKIQARDADLVLATFGRSIWILDNIRPLRALARQPLVLDQSLKVFPPQTAVLAAWRSFDGPHFPADAAFSGANKGTGARIPVWVKPGAQKKTEKADKADAKDDKKGDKKEKATVLVLSMNGDTLRRWKTALDTGFNVVGWGLDTRGVRFPSNQEPDKDELEPGGGPRVLPGSYKIVVHYAGQRDSTALVVQPDARLDITLAEMEAKSAAIRDFYKQIDKVRSAYERLKSAEKTIKLVEEQWVNVPDSIKKDALKLGKTLRDSISNLKAAFFEQKELKGIQRNPNFLNSIHSTALGYLNAGRGAPNETTQLAIRNAQVAAEKVLTRVDRLLDKPWAEYRQKAEAIPYSLFDKP